MENKAARHSSTATRANWVAEGTLQLGFRRSDVMFLVRFSAFPRPQPKVVEGFTLSPSATWKSIFKQGSLTPLSNSEMYTLDRPQASAKASCVRPRASRRPMALPSARALVRRPEACSFVLCRELALPFPQSLARKHLDTINDSFAMMYLIVVMANKLLS